MSKVVKEKIEFKLNEPIKSFDYVSFKEQYEYKRNEIDVFQVEVDAGRNTASLRNILTDENRLSGFEPQPLENLIKVNFI